MIAAKIVALEGAREEAEDFTTTLELGKPTRENPLGKANVVEVNVPIHATTIRMALVEQLTPLYTELRNLGIELQLK